MSVGLHQSTTLRESIFVDLQADPITSWGIVKVFLLRPDTLGLNILHMTVAVKSDVEDVGLFCSISGLVPHSIAI